MASTRRGGPGGTARGPGARRRSTPTTAFVPTLPSPGTVFGGLEVLRFLGEGGMGHLLLARDRALGRAVAVKFLGRRLLGDLRAERRFRREGRTLAALQHPHVVRVYGVGSWEGWPYLLMEFVEGISIAARLRDGRLPVPEALRIGEELASALAEIHARQILHRDVKPANVMLRGDAREACLVDFGLSRGLDTTTHSSSGAMGTAFYMAPEQMAGRRQDSRVDVYAFGATLFEALTGRTPHLAEEPAALFHAVQNVDPPLLRTLLPEAPRGLEVLLSRCLARAPELRPADGEALLAELRALRAALDPDAPARAAAIAEPRRATTSPRDPAEPFPLLGRAPEVESLRAALEEAEASRGALLLVEGEAGAGKSRFLREAAILAAARAFEVLRCDAGEHAGSPLAALRETLLAQGRARGLSTPKRLAESVREGDSGEVPLPALRWLLEDRGDAASAPAKSELARAFLSVLRSFLRDRPALLSVDDAHLLDERSLDLLEAAAAECRSLPLVLALSYRPRGRDPTGGRFSARVPALAALPGARSLPLAPLSQGAVASLVMRALRVDEAEACRLAPVLHKRSGGNPLYLVESLRMLEEEGRVLEDAGGRRLGQRVTRLSLPPRLREIALRRILGLPAREKEVLEALSVDPAGLSAAVVARCLDTSERDALRALQELVVARGLVSRTQGGFAVPHAEIREAAYSDLLPELRTAYHALAAKALEAAGAAATEPARLARHWRLGGEPAKAVPLLVAEGKRLLDLHVPAEALTLLDEALSCAGPQGCFEASLKRAVALEALGEMRLAEKELRRLSRAKAPADGFDANLQLAMFLRTRGRMEEAWAALPSLADGGWTSDQRLRLCVQRMILASSMERGEDADALVVEALPLEAGAGPDLRLRSCMARGSVHWRRGRVADAYGTWLQAVPLAEQVGDGRNASILLGNLALACHDLGRNEDAIGFARRAAERALVLGALEPIVRGHLGLARFLTAAGRLEEAERALAEAEAVLPRYDNSMARLLRMARRTELALARGDGAGAERFAGQGLALAEGAPGHASEFRVLRAEALLLLGRPGEALADAREARRVLRSLGLLREEQDAVAMAAASLRALGQRGAEREELPRPGSALTVRAALEAAAEAPDTASREARLAEAAGLARSERERELVAAARSSRAAT